MALLRLAYASRNLVPAEAMRREIQSILDTSRRRNAASGITGALLFSADAFVQAIEGPPAAVEALFETIQMDLRHADVVVLQAAPMQERAFAHWSMAYAGRHDDLRFEDLRPARGDIASSAMVRLLQGAMDRLSMR